jgi:hypothetical protein
MKKLAILSFVGILSTLTLSSPALTQDAPPAEMGYIVVVDPLLGHGSAFEEGAKKHMEWYADAGGTWPWAVFEVSMGERTGQWVWFSGSHSYADFDTPDVDPTESDRSLERNITPHVSNVEVSLTRLMPDLSMIVADAPVRPLYEVITFQLKPGKDAQFTHVLKKLKTAFAGLGDQVEYGVYQAAQGGRGGQWLVSIPHESFASMGGDADFEGLMAEVLGDFEAQSVLDMLDDAIASETREVFALRSDLSLNLGN